MLKIKSIFDQLDTLKADLIDTQNIDEFTYIFDGYVDLFYKSVSPEQFVNNFNLTSREGIDFSTKLIMFNNFISNFILLKGYTEIRAKAMRTLELLNSFISRAANNK